MSSIVWPGPSQLSASNRYVFCYKKHCSPRKNPMCLSKSRQTVHNFNHSGTLNWEKQKKFGHDDSYPPFLTIWNLLQACDPQNAFFCIQMPLPIILCSSSCRFLALKKRFSFLGLIVQTFISKTPYTNNLRPRETHICLPSTRITEHQPLEFLAGLANREAQWVMAI